MWVEPGLRARPCHVLCDPGQFTSLLWARVSPPPDQGMWLRSHIPRPAPPSRVCPVLSATTSAWEGRLGGCLPECVSPDTRCRRQLSPVETPCFKNGAWVFH